MEQQTILNGISTLEPLVARLGVRRLLLVADSSFRYLNIRAQVESVGVPYVVFDQFGSNPLYEDVCKGVELFRQRQCDGILAVGGGSSIDVAKCIKLYCKMDPRVNYLEQEPMDSGVPLVAVPTTAGTGSESTRFAVIYYGGKKQSVNHESIIPNYAILEPSVLRTLPLYQKKCTVMDALCQGIESWWSIHSTEESRRLSRRSVELLVDNVGAYVGIAGGEESDTDVAETVMQAANMAGQAINITQTTAPHAFSYKLTSWYGLPHGHAVAVCLPVIWEYMLDNVEQSCIDSRGADYLINVFNQIAQALHCNSAREGVVFMRRLIDAMQLANPIGKDRTSELDMLVSSVNPIRLKNNPVRLDEAAIRGIYERIVYNKL